jgi:hypothetical protein
MSGDCPAEHRLKAEQAIREVLQHYDDTTPASLVQEVVTTAREAALKNWRSQCEVESIIEHAVWGLPDKWKLQARQRIGERVRQVNPANLAQLKAICVGIAEETRREYDLDQVKQRIRDTYQYWRFHEATSTERERVHTTVERTLTGLPIGTTYNQADEEVRKEMKPLEAALDARLERDRAEEECQAWLSRAQHQLTFYLHSGAIEWGPNDEIYATAAQLRQNLEPAFLEACRAGEVELDSESVREWVQDWTDEELGLNDEDG